MAGMIYLNMAAREARCNGGSLTTYQDSRILWLRLVCADEAHFLQRNKLWYKYKSHPVEEAR